MQSSSLRKCLIFFTLFCFLVSEGYVVYRLPKRTYITQVPGLEFLAPYYSNYGGRPGGRIILRCKVKSETRPNVIWEKMVEERSTNNTFTILRSEVDKRIRIRLRTLAKHSYVSKLNIARSRASDTGLYRCRIWTNIQAKLQRKFYVNINASVVTPVRLMSTTGVGEGRVEIFHRRRWGTISYAGFTSIEAFVVCRSLGYKYGGEPRFHFDWDPIIFPKKRKNDRLWFRGIHCSLNSTDIMQCKRLKGNLFYTKYDPVGVTCRLTPIDVPKPPVQLFTKAGKNQPEGFVEVFKDGHWGRVCRNNVGQPEINLICKMLGFLKGGLGFKAQDTYRMNRLDFPGMGREILQNLRCPTNATSIDDCSHEQWGEQCTSCGCNGGNSLAVRCWTNESDNTRSVRLAASNIPHEGRVEILHNNTWGTVTSAFLGQPGANVLCKMAGYQHGGLPLYNNIPPGRGPIWIDKINCPLHASDLKECSFRWGAPDYRSHFHDVGLSCRLKPVEVPDDKIRLIGPKSHLGEGRLEVFRDGYWGTVCRAYMGTSEASMFCHMLGYRNGGYILRNPDNWPELKLDYGPSLIEYMECPWNSSGYNDCSERHWTHTLYKQGCGKHANDAGLLCLNESYPEIQIKLLGGERKNEGKLVVKFQGKWTTVCGRGFKGTSLAPICKQLGYRYGGEFWEIKNPIYQWFLFMDCNGKEHHIGQCNSFREGYCVNNQDVFVKCYLESDNERQITVSQEEDGKVVLHRNGTSWRICAESWDNVGANIVCQMLHNRTGSATFIGYDTSHLRKAHGENSIQDLYCQRNTRHLGDCFFKSWIPGKCAHDGYFDTFRGGVSCSLRTG